MILTKNKFLATILVKSLIIVILIFGFSIAAKSDAYFQQYVNYEIDVKLDVDYHSLSAHETLLYTNNSTDTLHEIYFHLYMNKYRKKSLASA